MNFLQAVNEVLESTKRPDKINTIRREINAAISFYCLDNEFARDYVEQAIPLDSGEYTQSFALSDLTRFRKFKFLKRGGTKDFLTKLSDNEMTKGLDRCNKYYVVGSSVNISLRQLADSLDVGFWTYPPVLKDADEFWLLDVSPYMIIDRASAAIFKDIGDEKSFQVHRGYATEHYMAARKDLLSNE